jgi:hypothetical protein
MGKLATFLRFVAQQRRERGRILGELEAVAAPPDPTGAAASATVELPAGQRHWMPTGVTVRAGQSFTVEARGALWLSRALAVGLEPRTALWIRIGGAAPIRKLLDNRTSFTAWADGAVELRLKTAEWASDAGDVLPRTAMKLAGAVTATIAVWNDARPADTAGAPADWRHLWRLGDGRIYAARDDEIDVATHGDVGILQLDCDHELTSGTCLDWSWRVDELPSRLPENLQVTHDYLSIAVEFENGQDLTYMWSAALPEGHVFRCPLPWWCERETHWVQRSGSQRLGEWLHESRSLAEDCRRAYGAAPRRVVRIWLIANSVFQRGTGRARFRDIGLVER